MPVRQYPASPFVAANRLATDMAVSACQTCQHGCAEICLLPVAIVHAQSFRPLPNPPMLASAAAQSARRLKSSRCVWASVRRAWTAAAWRRACSCAPSASTSVGWSSWQAALCLPSICRWLTRRTCSCVAMWLASPLDCCSFSAIRSGLQASAPSAGLWRQRACLAASSLTPAPFPPSRCLLLVQVVMELPNGERREAWLSRKQLKGQEPLLRGFVRQLRE